MSLRVSASRPVQAPACQQRQVTSGLLPRGPTAYTGGHARRMPVSTPMHTWRKLGLGMDRAGHVGPDASHRWRRWLRADPVRSVQARANAMRRPAGDALINPTLY
jgi:hypothetical protein